MMKTYVTVLQRSLDFSGRSSRREYWAFMAWQVLLFIVATMADVMLGTFHGVIGLGWLGLVLLVLTFVPSLALSVRRLHDIGQSGWWAVIGLLPGLGEIALMVAALLRSQAGDNRYGPDPTLKRRDPSSRRSWPARLSIAGAVIALLVVGAIVAGKHFAPQAIADFKRVSADGASAGASISESACLGQVHRKIEATGAMPMGDVIRESAWLTGCLQASQPEPAFCKGTPRQEEIMAYGLWLNLSCAEAGLAGRVECQTIMPVKSRYCASAERTQKVAKLRQAPAELNLDVETARSLMVRSGIAELINSIPKVVKTAAESQMGGLPEVQRSEFMRAVAIAYAANRVREEVIARLTRAVEAADAEDLLAWYESDLGRSIAAMEVSAQSRMTDIQAVIREGLHALAIASPVRAQLLRQLVEVSRQDDKTSRLSESVRSGILRRASQARQESGTMAAAVRPPAATGLPSKKDWEAYCLAAATLTYAKISDEDLRSYVEFSASPAAVRFNDAAFGALEAAYVSSSQDLGSRLLTLKLR